MKKMVTKSEDAIQNKTRIYMDRVMGGAVPKCERRGRFCKMMIDFSIDGIMNSEPWNEFFQCLEKQARRLRYGFQPLELFSNLRKICAHLRNLRMPFSNLWKGGSVSSVGNGGLARFRDTGLCVG